MHAHAPLVLEVLATATGLAGPVASDLHCFKNMICEQISCQCQCVQPHKGCWFQVELLSQFRNVLGDVRVIKKVCY